MSGGVGYAVPMIRTLFFLLVLVNLLFFAWTQGYFGTLSDGREPQRISTQLAPERLRVVGIGSVPDGPVQVEQVCRLVSGLTRGEAQRLMAQATDNQPGLNLVVKTGETPKNVYWVFIPPLANKLAAELKSAELKKRDIVDFSIVLDKGADQLAILLGVFKSESAANAYLKELAKRSVKSAKLQARQDPLENVQLEARGPADLLARQLAELLDGQGAVKTGDCPPGR